MGRKTLYACIVSASIGFVAALFTLSLGTRSRVPLLLLILCPAGALELFIPTINPDPGFLWLVAIVNTAIYGLGGLIYALYSRLDDD